MSRRKTISMETKEYVLERDKICYVCGKSLEGCTTNIDHIIPVIVAKWCRIGDSEELLEKFNAPENLAAVHVECNTAKSVQVYELDIYRNFLLNDFSKFEKFYKRCRPYIEDFITFREEILDVHAIEMSKGKYKGVCHICQELYDIDELTVRRKDSALDRDVNNTVLICNSGSCNATFTRRKKRKNTNRSFLDRALR